MDRVKAEELFGKHFSFASGRLYEEANCLSEKESSWKGLNGIALYKFLTILFSSLRS